MSETIEETNEPLVDSQDNLLDTPQVQEDAQPAPPEDSPAEPVEIEEQPTPPEEEQKEESKVKKKKEKKQKDPSEKKPFKLFGRKKEEPPVEKPKVRRVKADPNTGLSVEQVLERINKGHINKSATTNDKTYLSIILNNLFTFFNILCIGVAVLLIIAGSFKNLFFLVIMLANTTIGIVQDIRAKKTIAKLSLLTAPTTKVIRGGVEYDVSTEEVVIDDIAIFSNGKQIVADCILIDGSVEVNESLLTGESVPIKKNKGDTLLAGSFISSGSCRARVDKIGDDCYVEQLSKKAKTYKKPNLSCLIR